MARSGVRERKKPGESDLSPGFEYVGFEISMAADNA